MLRRAAPCLLLLACTTEVQGLDAGRVRDASPAADGGTLAGDAAVADGGAIAVDAGTPGACRQASDCRGAGMSVPACAATGGASAFSCVDERCVWACGPARTCRSPAQDLCLDCEGEPNIACPATACAAAGVGTASIEQATCPYFPGTTVPFDGARVTITRTSRARCELTAYLAAGAAQLGDLAFLEDGRVVARIPRFGGTCVGELLPTGALRAVISCPECMFVILF